MSLFKEEITPVNACISYYLAPIVALVPALTTMAVLPFGCYIDANGVTNPLILANIDIGILFILAVSSLGVYGIVLAGQRLLIVSNDGSHSINCSNDFV